MLLLISLAAIITGIVCLWLDAAPYGSPPYKDVPSVMLRAERAAGLVLGAPAATREAPAAAES
jgi:hypothetical protein